MILINFNYSQVECKRVTPWWKLWEKTYWVTTKPYSCEIITDKFHHKLDAEEGIVFDKRSGPFIVGILYPKWGVKRIVGRWGSKKPVFNVDAYRALILWHDCVWHNIDGTPNYDEIAELFDLISEYVGFSDLRSDLGEFFTKHFGKSTFGGDDEMSIENKKRIKAQIERTTRFVDSNG